MKKKFNLFNGVVIFMVTFIGLMLNGAIGLSASLSFWGLAVCVLAIIFLKKPNLDLKEEYRELDAAKKRNTFNVISIFLMGIACLITAVVLYFNHNIVWVLILLAVLVILIIPAINFDRKFWAQIPREDRPWAYQDMKTKDDDVAQQ